MDEGFRIEVFGDAACSVRDADVIELWTRGRSVAPKEAARRMHEVLLVGVDADDRLAGVTTAFLRRNDQLGLDLWHVRVFVAQERRSSALALSLVVAARDALEQRHVDGTDSRGAGVAFEVEHRGLQQHRPWGVWRRPGFTFIGENRHGAWVRVRYFPGALAPAPAS